MRPFLFATALLFACGTTDPGTTDAPEHDHDHADTGAIALDVGVADLGSALPDATTDDSGSVEDANAPADVGVPVDVGVDAGVCSGSGASCGGDGECCSGHCHSGQCH